MGNNLHRLFEESGNFADYATKYREYLLQVLMKINPDELNRLVSIILGARDRGNVVYIVGNGGSASAASHMACDLMKNTFIEGEKPLKAVSLVDNVSIMTALANDDGYDRVFVDQIKHLLKQGDVVIVLSASGNSPNVVEVLKFANSSGVTTVAIVGFDGGVCKDIAQEVVYIPTEKGEYGPVEDVHIIINHMIASYLPRHMAQGKTE